MTLHVIGFCSEAIRVLNVGTTSFCLKSFCLLTIRLLVIKRIYSSMKKMFTYITLKLKYEQAPHTHTHTLSLYTHTHSLSLSLYKHTHTQREITHLTTTSCLSNSDTGLLHYNSSMNTMKCRKQHSNYENMVLERVSFKTDGVSSRPY